MSDKTKKGIKNRLKYAILNKKTEKIDIYYFKTDVAKVFGVEPITISRNKTYENDDFKLFLVGDVVLTRSIGYNCDIMRWKYRGEK